MYYFLFRKILYALLILAGIGFVILLLRSFWMPSGDRPATNVAVHSPAVQETVPLSSAEAKPDLKAEALPEIKREQTTPQPAQDPKNRILGRETPSPTPPAPIETKTALPVPKAEPKPVAPAPKKEVKTEPKPENISKIPKSDLPMGKEPSPSKTNSQPNHTVVVKAGDSIYSIAAEAYRVSNTSVVDRILEVNPKISNPDLLPTKQQIKLPIITEESLVLKSPDGFFRVLLGAFMKPEFADYLKGQPVLQEKEIEILPWTSPSGKTWYRVTVGKFESREEGLKVIRILKENGLSPYFEGFKKKN